MAFFGRRQWWRSTDALSVKTRLCVTNKGAHSSPLSWLNATTHLSNTRHRFPTIGLLSLALLVSLGHSVLAVLAMREKSTTTDELAHVTGGYTFNHWNDYRLHPENGVLPQRWQALPLSWIKPHYPDLTDSAWKKSDVWQIGHQFFYEAANDCADLLASARFMNSLFGAATALLVFFWSYRLWGRAGALVSTGFCVLCPTMLAHSGLATSDMCMTFFLLLAVSCYWHHLQVSSAQTLLLSATVFGLASVAKHTSVLLLPMALLLALVRLNLAAPISLGRFTACRLPGKLGVLALTLLVHGGVIVMFIWTFFGFRYSAFNPALPSGDFYYPWAMMLSFGGVKAQVIDFCRTWHLLPEGYLYGLAFVLKHAEARGAFLDGDYSIFGWVSFFPKTFFYKTPLPLLTAIATSTGLLALYLSKSSLAQFRLHLLRVAPLIVLFTVYWIFSLTSHLNIGHRHILPTYPVLYIFCGALGWVGARAWANSRLLGSTFVAGTIALLGWQGAVAVNIYPHYLAYFSPIAGGPAEGYKHLVDSSLDWGQDLPGLKKWLTANRRPAETIYLSYFGCSEPDYYHIDAVRLPMIPDFKRSDPWYACEAGLYAISASMLQHVYMPQRGPWTADNERQYQELRRNDGNFRALKANPKGAPELTREISLPQWSTAWTRYEKLRFARLCHYLRARHPDAMIGYSILVFRLNQNEINDALNGSASTLANAVERALQGQTSSYGTH